MSSLIKLFFLTITCFFVLQTIAQTSAPFYGEIQAFKKEDSISLPEKNAILFIGSSSFRKWTNLKEMFPGYTILNRAFGGSTFPDVIGYANDVIFPYQPKQVIIYCGDNDIATDTVDAKMVLQRFKTLFQLIRMKIPAVPVVFVSIKPSPSREKYLAVIKQANQLINNFLYQQQNVGFADVYSRMIDANGKPLPQLFIEDQLHMNDKGYVIWQEVLSPYLLK